MRLGPLDQIPVGEGRAFGVDGAAGRGLPAAQRRGARRVGGLPAQGRPDRRRSDRRSIVLCPLHMNAFELATGCSTTGQPDLQTWRVDVEDNEIVLYSA